MLTVYMVALAAGQLIYGPLSDRIGRRPVLLFGALLYGITGLLMTASEDVWILTLLRGLQGLGGAACMAMGRAIINDVYERTEAARQMSTIAIVLAVVPALSLAFGGLLAESFGWISTMLLLSMCGFLVLLLGSRVVAETHVDRQSSLSLGSMLVAYRDVLSDRLFLGWTMSSAMQIAIFFSMNGFLGYQYIRNGYSLTEFGMWFALTPVSYLIGNSINRQWLVDWGIERAAMLGCLLSFIAVLLLYVTQAMGMSHALSLALPCCLFGFSNGIVVANSTVGAMAAAGRHAGTGTGIVGAWQMAAGGISGAIIAKLGGADIYSVMALTLVVMSLISVFSMYYVYKRR